MGAQLSAGILAYRRNGDAIEVLVAHPGGPFWAAKDDGAWSLPKGLVDDGEDVRAAAVREFAEETGCVIDPASVRLLGEVQLKSGKRVVGFAVEADCDPELSASNRFELEWPPRSGKVRSFPEVDRIEWMTPDVARTKLNAAQVWFVDRLLTTLGGD